MAHFVFWLKDMKGDQSRLYLHEITSAQVTGFCGVLWLHAEFVWLSFAPLKWLAGKIVSEMMCSVSTETRNHAAAAAAVAAAATHLTTLSDSVAQWLASWCVAQDFVSLTLPCAPVAHWGVTAGAANNCDSCHVSVLGRLFSNHGGA